MIYNYEQLFTFLAKQRVLKSVNTCNNIYISHLTSAKKGHLILWVIGKDEGWLKQVREGPEKNFSALRRVTATSSS